MAQTVIYLIEESFVEFVAGKISDRLKSMLEEKEKVFLVLAGGKTPIPIYRTLAEYGLAWEKIHFFLSDERYVPLDSVHSNFKVIKEAFFERIRIPKENVHFIDTSLPLDEAAERYEREIRSLTHMFDLSILGMGTDGHVASIFDPKLGNSERWVMSVPPSGEPRVERISLSFSALNCSEYVYFVISGEEKKRKLAEILLGSPLPASFVRGRTETVWFLYTV